MIRTLLQVVLLRDRTRVFGEFRFRRLARVLLLAYGLVTAIGSGSDYVQYENPEGWWPLLFAITFGAFGLMPFSTLAAWRLALVGVVAFRLLTTSEPALLGPWQWACFLPAVAAVAAHHSGRVVAVVALITSAALFCMSLPDRTGSFLPTAGLVLLVVLLGYALGARGRAEQRFHAERDEKAALVERARIAREMHDVVAHHMSMVVVRCETAPYRISGLPEAGLREFAELGDAARAAITDMQGLLGVLRAGGQQADRAPQPGLADIRVLDPAASVTDEPVPEAVGLTAYRIVQEALTNASRHAPGSAVSVEVSAADGVLEVLVRNTAGGPSLGGGGGHGLVGMRERVAVHGGAVTTGSTEDGGFAVRARIPMGER